MNKLRLENDRLRKQLSRSERAVTSGATSHVYDTRAAAEDKEETKLRAVSAAAASILLEASVRVSTRSDYFSPFEKLERSHLKLAVPVDHPGAMALAALVDRLSDDLDGVEIASALVFFLPLSFFVVLGKALNEECRGLSLACSSFTLSHRLEGASNGVNLCLRHLFMTQAQERGIASAERESDIDARKKVLLSLVGFTLNPSDCTALQRPVAQLIAQGNVVQLHNLLNSMGLSVSHTDWFRGAETRRTHSQQLLEILLKAWVAASEDKRELWLKEHIDNFDKTAADIHMLLVGLTRCDPPSQAHFNQFRFYEIEANDLFAKSRQLIKAVRIQDQKCVAMAVAIRAVPGSEALVLRLAADAEAAAQTAVELAGDRSSRRPGRKPGAVAVSEADVLARDVGQLFKAERSLVTKDELGRDFSIKPGDELRVLSVFPDREFVVLQKRDGGPATQCAYVPASVFVRPMLTDCALCEAGGTGGEGESVQAAAADKLAETIARDDALRAAAADARVELSVLAELSANSHLPQPRAPRTSAYVGLFDGLASSRSDCDAALHATTAMIRSILPETAVQVIVSCDGQPFSEEMKFRDLIRQRHQENVTRANLELGLHGHSAEAHVRLEQTRRDAEAKRDAVSDLPPVELGNLHALFAGVRACFKKNGDFAFRGLAERMGLGHAYENMAKCSSGYLALALDFFRAIRLAWIAEMEGIILDTTGSADIDVLEFIAAASPCATTLRVCHRALFIEPGAVVHLRASDRMRGSAATELQRSARKDLAMLVATGGCPNYVKNLVWVERQELTCPKAAQQLLATNTTTCVKETGQNFASDEYLESFFVKGAAGALGNVHRANARERSAELNATLGSTHQVENDMRPCKPALSDGPNEHKSALNEAVVVAIARATIREYFQRQILKELDEMSKGGSPRQPEEPASGRSSTTSEAKSGESKVAALPRIPTREEERKQATRAASAAVRKFNPMFLRAEDVGAERLLAAAKWCLRDKLGGQYMVSESLKTPTFARWRHNFVHVPPIWESAHLVPRARRVDRELGTGGYSCGGRRGLVDGC